MNIIQDEKYYRIKELQNIMNNFEKAYPILMKNIDEFNIRSEKDQAYLAWIAGMNFYKHNLTFSEKILQNLLFKNLYKTLNFNVISQRAVMFVYFALGTISIANYKSKSKEFYNEYMNVISKGVAIIDSVKFDRYVDGYRYWDIRTLAQFFKDESEDKVIDKNNHFKEAKVAEEISSRTIN